VNAFDSYRYFPTYLYECWANAGSIFLEMIQKNYYKMQSLQKCFLKNFKQPKFINNIKGKRKNRTTTFVEKKFEKLFDKSKGKN